MQIADFGLTEYEIFKKYFNQNLSFKEGILEENPNQSLFDKEVKLDL